MRLIKIPLKGFNLLLKSGNNNKLEMKKLFTIALVVTSSIGFAQLFGAVDDNVLSDKEIPDALDSLKIAIPLLIVGFLIAYIFMWSKKDISKEDNTSTNIGCFGVIIMGIGAIFLLPIISLTQDIINNIKTIGFAIVFIAIIIISVFAKK